jgi:hypothetical protein
MLNALKSLLKRLYLRVRFFPPGILLTFKLMAKNIIVIHIQETGLQEHINPVIEWLITNSNYMIVVVVRRTQLTTYLRENALLFKLGNPLVLVSEECFSNVLCAPRLVLSLHPEAVSQVAQRFRNTGLHRIVMHHGLADKYVSEGEENSLSCYTGFFLNGPASREGSLKSYAERYPDDFKRLKLFNIGSPKTDAIFKHNVERETFLLEMGLDSSKKVICYAPTYQRTASLEQCGIEIMQALAKLPVNVIVKLHHVSLKTGKNMPEPWVVKEIGSKNWINLITELDKKHGNIKLASVQNANPYLQISDVLVSDASGVAFEYLLLDKPIVFFDVPDFFAAYGKQGLHYWGRECGDIVDSTDALVAAVKNCLDNPEYNGEARKKVTEMVVYNKGCATAYAGKTIIDLSRNAI